MQINSYFIIFSGFHIQRSKKFPNQGKRGKGKKKKKKKTQNWNIFLRFHTLILQNVVHSVLFFFPPLWYIIFNNFFVFCFSVPFNFTAFDHQYSLKATPFLWFLRDLRVWFAWKIRDIFWVWLKELRKSWKGFTQSLCYRCQITGKSRGMLRLINPLITLKVVLDFCAPFGEYGEIWLWVLWNMFDVLVLIMVLLLL